MSETLDWIRRLLVGRPVRSEQMSHTLLPKRIALPVFASDALSSVAYAPDEVLLTLSLAGGIAAANYSLWVGIAVVFVLGIVVMSYRQTVHAYPSGGGDYQVVHENFGPRSGLVVASALLVDYMLTVAVSVSQGAHYLTTALPSLHGHEALIAVAVVLALSVLNLRGMRESGTAFAIPTYIYMLAIFSMIGFGLFQEFTGTLQPAASAVYEVAPEHGFHEGIMGFAGFFLVLRAFSSGCAALTGVEAISNGVPAFRKPKSRNAAITLTLLGCISALMMLSILHLARATGTNFVDDPATQLLIDGRPVGKDLDIAPVIGQLADTVFADFRPMFYLVTIVTGLILVLAANTAFNGFPQLASVLSRDSFLPHQLHNRGDRLSFSNGILLLAVSASALILVFNAEVTQLIQLYIVGVFISFTFSQVGMVRHWNRHLALETSAQVRRNMRRSRTINLIGLACTGTVLVVVLLTKFTHGAYLALLMMLVVFLLMNAIRSHYDSAGREIQVDSLVKARSLPARVHALVLVSRLHKPAMRAISYARAANPSSLEIVSVAVDEDEVAQLRRQWEASGLDIPLTFVASPFRDISRPVLSYVRAVRARNPQDLIVVYIPEFLVQHWWQQALHNQTAFRIKTRLMREAKVVVSAVPYQLGTETTPVQELDRKSIEYGWAQAEKTTLAKQKSSEVGSGN